MLYLLAANAGQVVTRGEILDTLWGVDYVSESNVVDRHIRNLRAKLQNDWRKPRFIETVPGKGIDSSPRSPTPRASSVCTSGWVTLSRATHPFAAVPTGQRRARLHAAVNASIRAS